MAVGVASLALVVGCGGGGEATTATRVTQAQFVKQTTAVCEKVRKNRSAAIYAHDEKLIRQGEDPQSKANLEEKLVSLLLPSMRSQLDQLKALEVPVADKEKWAKMLQRFTRGIEKLEEEKLAGLANDPELESFGEEAGALGVGRCVA